MMNVKIFYGLYEIARRDMRWSETLLSLIRNQQAEGSTPPAGSNEIKGAAYWLPLFLFMDRILAIETGALRTTVIRRI